MESVGMPQEKLKVEYTHDIGVVKEAWLALENTNSIPVYQKYDWVNQWYNHMIVKNSSNQHVQPIFLSVFRSEKVVVILPLCIIRNKGIRFLSWLADEHCNYQGALFDSDFLRGLNKSDFQKLWLQIEGLLPKFDVLWLRNQVLNINGTESPFRWIDQHTSPNSGHQLVFKHHNWDELLIELRSKSTRKRMRNEESRLSREGELSWKRVSDQVEVEFYLNELFDQREQRFKLLGIDLESNVSLYKDFYLKLLTSSVNEPTPFVYMMVVELDQFVLATMLLAESGNMTYLLINSMTSSKYHKWSPGDYLIRLTLQEGCMKQSELIDFGVSEDSNYKTAWCNTKLEMFETIKGQGWLGKGIALLIRNGSLLKRKVKQSPKLWSFYCSFRSGDFRRWLKK